MITDTLTIESRCLSRTQSSGVEMFGCSEDDDVDCLFFIYARFLSDKQEGQLL